MPDGGFFERKRVSPTSLMVVVLLHGAVLTALAMSKMDVPVMKIFEPIEVENVPIQPDPPPIPEPMDDKAAPKSQSQIDYVKPFVPLLSDGPSVTYIPDLPTPSFDPSPPGDAPIAPEPAPTPAPVRIEAEMLARSELLPPYPPSEQRAGAEGRVVIRVRIGADGRVKSAENVSAASDAFYRATERHALRAWRFKPATLGGDPIESSKTLTVVFRLDT